MATPLDTGLLVYLTPVFVFIFIFAFLYALLTKLKLFGANSTVHTAIAFSVSFLLIISPSNRTILAVFTPWFALLVVLTVFIFLFFMFLGLKEESILYAIRTPSFITFAVAFIFILFLIAMTQTFGPFLVAHSGPGFWNATKRVLFHPQTIGVLFLLMVAAYTVNYLSSPTPK